MHIIRVDFFHFPKGKGTTQFSLWDKNTTSKSKLRGGRKVKLNWRNTDENVQTK